MLARMNRLEPSGPVQRFWRAAECGALFLGVPAASAAGWLPVNVILLLLLAAAGCWLVLNWRYRIRLRDSWHARVPRVEWRRIISIYAVAVLGLGGLLWLAKPTALFSLLGQNPRKWLLVMFAYPIVSVMPQEVIYRVFFFERYRALFGRGAGMVFTSATVFSFGHVVFHNWPAMVLTLAGGLLFAKTYQRTGSLRLVAFEHALYGGAVFTIGYGEFFFAGTMKLFR